MGSSGWAYGVKPTATGTGGVAATGYRVAFGESSASVSGDGEGSGYGYGYGSSTGIMTATGSARPMTLGRRGHGV